MAQQEDIFDRIMHLPLLRPIRPVYLQKKELLLYLFFGGIAFFLNFFLFVWIDKSFHIHELLNNTICWIICIVFQFVTNRTWVFQRRGQGRSTGVLVELSRFFVGRVFTLVVEEIILLLFISFAKFPAAPVKFLGQILVIVLNYIISKRIVFQ